MINRKNQAILEKAIESENFLSDAKEHGYSAERMMDEISNMTDTEMLYRSCKLIEEASDFLMDKKQGVLRALFMTIEELKRSTKAIEPVMESFIKVSKAREASGSVQESIDDVIERWDRIKKLTVDIDDDSAPEDAKGQSYLCVLFDVIMEKMTDINQSSSSSALYRESTNDPEALEKFIRRVKGGGVASKGLTKERNE